MNMNSMGTMEYVWLRLRRLPRWIWIACGLAMLIVPALLLWLAISLFGGAWQAGSAWLGQGREALQSALPAEVKQLARELPNAETALGALQIEAQQRVQGEVERLRAAVPASAEALQQELVGGAVPAAAEGLRQLTQQSRASAEKAVSTFLGSARPSTDVSGEDPPGIARLPGFVRTGFSREENVLRVSWAGAAAHAEVTAFYTQQLTAAGYSARVLAANAQAETVEFESPQQKLVLAVRSDGRGGSEVDWEVL